MARRDYALIGGFLVVAAAVALLLFLLLGRGGDEPLTRAEYLAKVEAVCREYNGRLARIPAPTAPANPDALARSISQALPLVEERAAKAKEIDPPPELEAQVTRMFERSDDAIAELRRARRAARSGDLRRSATAFGRFLAISDDAHQRASAIGLNC